MKIRKKGGVDWQTLAFFAAGVLVIIAATRKNQQTQMLVDKIASIIPAGGQPAKGQVLTA